METLQWFLTKLDKIHIWSSNSAPRYIPPIIKTDVQKIIPDSQKQW